LSSRGILAGGPKNFLSSGLLTGVSEYQWEYAVRKSDRWALGDDYFKYYN
jgi:hypothetical protein